MQSGFESITPVEYNKLKSAIPTITVLIAGADGQIDEDERAWAKKVTDIRSYKLPDELKHFYKDVGLTFTQDLDELIRRSPTDKDAFIDHLSCKLEEINPILQKLDNKIAFELYSSFKSFAKHVAKASGGFLGFGAIGPEEHKLIKLSMLNPIELDEDQPLL